VKYAWIESIREQYPAARLCRLLDVSHTGYCQWRIRASSERATANAALDVNVASLHAQSGQTYGRPRIIKALRGQGHAVGHERIRQSLLRQGLPRCTSAHTVHDRFQARLRRWRPMSLVGALMAGSPTKPYRQQHPKVGLIMHTDRGSQCASNKYRKRLGAYTMIASMSRSANCWDNAVAERFFKTLKVERVYRRTYPTRDHARLDIVNWIEGFHNRCRLHSSSDFQSPVDAEARLMAA
jgi:putative transposase